MNDQSTRRSRWDSRHNRLNWRLNTIEMQARQVRRQRAEAYAEQQVQANFPRIDVDNATEVIAFREQCITDYIALHDLPLDEVTP